MMRRLIPLLILPVLLATAYVASPFVAAWGLHEAVRTGDLETIERKIAWPSVRRTLRASIAQHAELAPIVIRAGRAVRPTLWQRVKRLFGASMLDRFIESRITPKGLHELYRERERRVMAARPTANTSAVEAATANVGDWRSRARAFVQQIKRAEFLGLTRVAIEVADGDPSRRRFVGVLDLVGIQWTLTELHVVGPDHAKPGATAIAGA